MKSIKAMLLLFLMFGYTQSCLTQGREKFLDSSNRSDVAEFYIDAIGGGAKVTYQMEFKIFDKVSGFNFDVGLDTVNVIEIYFEKNEELTDEFDISFELKPTIEFIKNRTARQDTTNFIRIVLGKRYTGRLNALFKRK